MLSQAAAARKVIDNSSSIQRQPVEERSPTSDRMRMAWSVDLPRVQPGCPAAKSVDTISKCGIAWRAGRRRSTATCAAKSRPRQALHVQALLVEEAVQPDVGQVLFGDARTWLSAFQRRVSTRHETSSVTATIRTQHAFDEITVKRRRRLS